MVECRRSASSRRHEAQFDFPPKAAALPRLATVNDGFSGSSKRSSESRQVFIRGSELGLAEIVVFKNLLELNGNDALEGEDKLRQPRGRGSSS